jgi:hypothetical protein
MTVTIPSALENAVQQKAAERQIGVERLVQEAVEWFLRMDADLFDELRDWGDVRDEAAQNVEDATP